MENQTHKTTTKKRGGQKVHRILKPASSVKFALGDKKYILSLEDKSRESINEAYSKISYLETENEQTAEVLQQEYAEKLADIDDKAETVKESVLMRQRNDLKNEYTKKLDAVANRSEEIATQEYKPFLDLLFGQKAGDEIFNMVGQNSIAVNKIIAAVMLEFNQVNNVEDYMTRQVNNIIKMKDRANGIN